MRRTRKTMIMRCETCARRRGSQCAVLKEMIGKDRDCSFWTDDPEWEEKAEAASREYALRRIGGK